MNAISRRGALLLVAACVLLALGLRMWALDARLPCSVNPDGSVIPEQVSLIRNRDPRPDSASVWQLYPHLIAEIVARLPVHQLKDDSLQAHLAAASAPLLEVRWAVALLSLITIPATYWLARHFLRRGAAVLAAFLSATSLLALSFAQQARPHAPAAAFAVLAIAAALRMARRPNWLNCTLASLALALAVGTLQSGVACGLPIAVAWILRDRSQQTAAQRWLAPIWIAVLAGSISYAFYAHTAPADAAAPDAPVLLGGLMPIQGTPEQDVRRLAGHNLHIDLFDGSGFATVGRTLLSVDPISLGLAVFTLALAALSAPRRRLAPDTRRSLIVAGAYSVPYLIAIGMYALTFERFCLQLLPFVACLAAGAWQWLAERTSRPLALACLLLIALPPLGSAIALQKIRGRASAESQVAEWLAAHVGPQERVLLLPGVDIPLLRALPTLRGDAVAPWTTPWVFYQRCHQDVGADALRYELGYAPLLRARDCEVAQADPLAAVRAASARIVVLAVPAPARLETPAIRLAKAFRGALCGAGVPALSFNLDPLEPQASRFMGYNFSPDDPIWAWNLLFRPTRWGPPLEVYDLR